MRNFTLLLFPALLGALSLHAQLSVGLRGGYNIASMAVKDPASGDKYSGIGSTGRLKDWHADIVFNLPVGANVYLQPLIRYITKGAYLEQHGAADPAGVYLPSASRLQLHYLELPANVVYKVPVSFGKIVAGLGPYLAYGLNGEYDLSIRLNGTEVQRNQQEVSFSNKDGILSTNVQLRRWDAGANFMLGVELGGLVMIGANYSLGLTDIDRSSYSSIRNRYWGISVGYLLNREDY